ADHLLRRAQGGQGRRRGPRDPRRAAARGRQAHPVHRLLHRQPEGREAQLLGARDRAGVAMATTQDIHAPTLGTQGEPCASCGAPLAGDQRYCLECGARRAQARVAFRDILGPGGASPPPPAGAPAAAPDDPPARSGLAFLVGLLCLLAALGVGVLIGNSGDDKTAATPPPAQVITVNGAAAATATTAAGTTST